MVSLNLFFSTPNQIICNRPSAGLSQPWLSELTFWKLASGEQGAGSPVSGSKEMLALNFRLNQCYSQPGFEAKSFTQSDLVTQRGRTQKSLRFPSVKRKLSLVRLKRSQTHCTFFRARQNQEVCIFLGGFWFVSLKIIMYFMSADAHWEENNTNKQESP